MMIRLFSSYSALLSIAAAQTAPAGSAYATSAAPAAHAARTAGDASAPAIRFEDASDNAGIHFTHSFGSRQLGSLLEGTGAGCIWFDYNNSGRQSLYVVNGRPLDDSMHPYPLKEKPDHAAAQSSLSQ